MLSNEKRIPIVPYREKWEEGKLDYGIGIIGIGKVANWAHLPTYEAAGLKVVAASSRNENARKIARDKWNIKKVFKNYRGLLELKEVDIVDVTVPHQRDDVRVQITKDAAKAGKHILMQKPMAMTYERAKEMVRIAKQERIKFAVNQNSRWGPAHFATKHLIKKGFIGKPQVAIIENIAPLPTHSQLAPEPMNASSLGMLAWSVHHYDIMRWWLGRDPVCIYSTLYNHTNFSILEFRDNIQACLREILLPQGRADENKYEFRIEGTKGVIKGCQGWHIHAGMAKDNVEIYSSYFPRQLKWFKIRLPYPSDPMMGRGQKVKYDLLSYPYAGFLGAMADLMHSIEQGRDPVCNGMDNLKVLQIMFAAYKSSKERRSIEIKEVQ